MNIDATLEARGDLYGDFGKNSAVMMQIVEAMMTGDNWHSVPQTHKAALTYIAGKISRIVCGDPNAVDNWHDIVGYAKLVESRLKKDEPYQGTFSSFRYNAEGLRMPAHNTAIVGESVQYTDTRRNKP